MGDSQREWRDKKLLGEFQELMEFSRRSPLVKVEPAGENFPPTEYLVTYDCLGYKDSGKTEVTTGHKVRITLTEQWPTVPPIFQYESQVWAPRFMESYRAPEHGSREIKHYICIGHEGKQEIPLTTYVVGVGHMIQLRWDSGGLPPLDTRSLEGQDRAEPDLPSAALPRFEIKLLDTETVPSKLDNDIVIKVIEDSRGDDLQGLIKIMSE